MINVIAVLLVCIAVFGAVTCFGIHGIWIGGLALAATVFVASGSNAAARVRRAASVLLLICVILLLLPFISVARLARYRAHCANNMKSIGVALHNYHDTFGSFPPAYLANETGLPTHSWRVLLLPFLERGDLFEQYDFDESWRGPNNSRLTSWDFRGYHCPTQSPPGRTRPATTSYLAVVGANTAWPGAEVRRLDEIADPGQTILVVECFDREVLWLEPTDISVEEAAVVPPVEVSLLGWWLGTEPNDWSPYHRFTGRNVLFADGSLRHLPMNVPASFFLALADIRDVPKRVPDVPPRDPPIPAVIRRLPFDPVTIGWAGFAIFLAALAGIAICVIRRK
jgi:prepilin-type processing-associated H-X9-DG protein